MSDSVNDNSTTCLHCGGEKAPTTEMCEACRELFHGKPKQGDVPSTSASVQQISKSQDEYDSYSSRFNPVPKTTLEKVLSIFFRFLFSAMFGGFISLILLCILS